MQEGRKINVQHGGNVFGNDGPKRGSSYHDPSNRNSNSVDSAPNSAGGTQALKVFPLLKL